MSTPTSLTILVTGATDGIGQQTALELARRGHRVVLHGRSEDKIAATEAAIRDEVVDATLEHALADLADLEQVHRLAEELDERLEQLDVLLNNAGVYMNEHRLSEDGLEMTMAVNHFAPFALTHGLIEALEAAPAGRIINVSSIAHQRGRVDLDDLNLEKGFDPYDAYATSKLANVLFTVELARRLQARGSSVTVNALHPGVVSTKLLTEGFGMRGADSLAEGAETSVYLATSEEVAGQTGLYFADCSPASVNPVAQQKELTRRFYERSAEIAGVEAL